MSITPSELRERTSYVDRSIEHGLAALDDARLERYLGDTSVLRNLLDGAIVANIDDDGIRIPNNYSSDTNSLVIAAARPEETVTVSPEFSAQTDTQKTATLRQLTEWGDRRRALKYYDARIAPSAENATPHVFDLSRLTFAMTGVAAWYTALYPGTMEVFFPKAANNEGYLQIVKRPLVILVMRDNHKFAPPDVVGHELAHVKQYMHNPVEIVKSQRSIDMNDLRRELEAYHLGAVIEFLENGEKPVELLTGNGDLDWSQLQSLVNTIRQANKVDSLDPYRPSPALLKRLSGLGEMILHSRIDYNWIVANFGGEQESSE